MDSFLTGIDPLYAIGSSVNANRVGNRQDAGKEFVSLFISQIVKQVFKSQSTMFGEEGNLGAFSDNLYNDILIDKISREIAESKSFGLDKSIMGKITAERIMVKNL